MKIEQSIAVLDDKEAEVWELTALIEAVERLPKGRAAKHALTVLPKPDPAFIQWVSVGTLGLVNGVIETMPYGRPLR